MSVMDPMTMSAPAMDTSPVHRINSASSEGECESRSPVTVGPAHSGESERPERMRDWLIRMINSNRFIGLEWLDKEKTIFKVPWIHAKKRGYCRERDAALFREWAIHSGKYRQDSDPTVWKINFRCAINGLKDIQEIKDMQTEDCRVYKVYPSRSRRRRRAVRRTAAEPYPNCSSTYNDMSSQHLYSTYQSMNQYHGLSSYPSNPVTSTTDPMYPAVPYTPNVKLEYPNPMCMQSSHYCMTGLSSSIPASTNGIYPTTPSHSTISTSCSKQTPYYSDHIPPVQTVPNLPAKVGFSPSSKVGFTRMDSPDSGINVESQNSPLMVQQNSPPQNSPLAQQHSSPAPSCSPPLQNHPSPLSTHSASPLSAVEQKPFSQPNNCSIGIASPLMSCNSPSGVSNSSPCPPASVLSEPDPDDDNDDVQSIINSLEGDTPTSPPISPQIPSGQLEVRVYYGTILARTEYVDCSKGACRILSSPAYQSPSAIKKVMNPTDQQVELPDDHPQSLSKDIFSAMGNGIVVEVAHGSIYVTPLCRTIVYCSNMAAPSQDAVQLNKDIPTKVFDYNSHFRPSLEHFAIFQGPSPAPSPVVYLGLGQSWGQGRTVTQNLVTVMVTHCKAKQDLESIMLPPEILGGVESINIDQPTVTDLEAEAFLKNLQEISNNN